jgi:hypothetical protein
MVLNPALTATQAMRHRANALIDHIPGAAGRDPGRTTIALRP